MNESLEWCVIVMNAAASSPVKTTDWSTIGVALITALAGGGTAWLNFSYQANRESASVRAALLAEVAALVELTEQRGYRELLHNTINYMKHLREEGYSIKAADFAISIPIADHYNRIYQDNAKRLGVLSVDEAQQVVRFYQLVDSLRADVSEGGALFQGAREIEPYVNAAAIFDLAIEVGKSLMQKRKRRRWWSRLCGRNVDT